MSECFNLPGCLSSSRCSTLSAAKRTLKTSCSGTSLAGVFLPVLQVDEEALPPSLPPCSCQDKDRNAPLCFLFRPLHTFDMLNEQSCRSPSTWLRGAESLPVLRAPMCSPVWLLSEEPSSCASPSLVESPVSGYQQGTALAQVFALPAAQLAHRQRLNKVGHEMCVEHNRLHAQRLAQLVPRLSKAV